MVFLSPLLTSSMTRTDFGSGHPRNDEGAHQRSLQTQRHPSSQRKTRLIKIPSWALCGRSLIALVTVELRHLPSYTETNLFVGTQRAYRIQIHQHKQMVRLKSERL